MTFLTCPHDISQRQLDQPHLHPSKSLNLSGLSQQLDPQEALKRLEAVIQAATDGIVTIDEKGVVETINEAGARLFGYTPEEVIGRNVSMLMPEPHRSQHDDYIRRYLETGQARIIGIGREVEGLRKDGTIFPIRLAVSMVELEGRKIFTGIIHDLTDYNRAKAEVLQLNQKLAQKNEELEGKVQERTEKLARVVDQLLDTNERLKQEIAVRQKTEQALRKREKELKIALEKEKELSELKSRFVSMASHEFRTPLSTILSSIELLEAYLHSGNVEKGSKHIERIKASVNHLITILNDFLSLSKLEEGNLQPQIAELDIEAFSREVLDEIAGLLKPGQTLHYSHEGPAILHSDKTFLKHIFSNLLSNAVKYSPDGKPIHLRTHLDGRALQVEVEDQGIGIPREDQRHLFTRFFRARNAENIKGTGLGLNIVRRYVEILGGEIIFESEEGKGTRFQVTLPLNPDAGSKTAARLSG
ncbi:MAG: PAS domain S-box protein [Bacteroidetes bacterium]|nr:MAG: PAS domain S-box protein [Bacteroidota bacterium]